MYYKNVRSLQLEGITCPLTSTLTTRTSVTLLKPKWLRGVQSTFTPEMTVTEQWKSPISGMSAATPTSMTLPTMDSRDTARMLTLRSMERILSRTLLTLTDTSMMELSGRLRRLLPEFSKNKLNAHPYIKGWALSLYCFADY